MYDNLTLFIQAYPNETITYTHIVRPSTAFKWRNKFLKQKQPVYIFIKAINVHTPDTRNRGAKHF